MSLVSGIEASQPPRHKSVVKASMVSGDSFFASYLLGPLSQVKAEERPRQPSLCFSSPLHAVFHAMIKIPFGFSKRCGRRLLRSEEVP
jgi:hypothetical protein